MVTSNRRIEIPFGAGGQILIVIGLGEQVVDDKRFAGGNDDAQVTFAGRLRVGIELLELVVASEAALGRKAGLQLIRGYLQLGVVGGGVGKARMARVMKLPEQRKGT